MGTEVLRPQDCLVERFRVWQPVFNRRKSSFITRNGFGNVRTNNYCHRKQFNRPERSDTKRKITTQPTTDQQFRTSPRRTSSSEELLNHFNKSRNHQLQNGFEMGRVTILRRGQSLDSFETKMTKENNINDNKTRGRIMKNKFNMDGGGYGYGDSLYAGSAFAVSPAPESLPLPSFFNTSNNNNKGCEYDDLATRGLRRLLRLE